MVRQMIENLGGGEAIILQLPNKGHGLSASFQSTHPSLKRVPEGTIAGPIIG
jgi:hypothetical protein